MTTHSRSVPRKRIVIEEVVKGWYLKRTPVAGSQECFISLRDWEVVLGRFVCSSPYISWEHVTFQKTENNDVFIKDLKSVSGTFVNGNKLKSKCLYPIHVGDRIALGKKNIKLPTDFEFELCYTQQPLKLKVTKIFKVNNIPAEIAASENRKHGDSRRPDEERSDRHNPENAPFPRSCIENKQPKAATEKVNTTVDHPSGSGNVRRNLTPNVCAKNSQNGESSREVVKIHHSHEGNLCRPLQNETSMEIDMTRDNLHNVDPRFGKERVVLEKLNYIEQRTTKEIQCVKSTSRNCPSIGINPMREENLQKANLEKEAVQEKPIDKHIDIQQTEILSVISGKDRPLEMDKILHNPQKENDRPNVEKEVVQGKLHQNCHEVKTKPRRDCYVNLVGCKEFVDSYMRKRIQRRTYSKQTPISYSDSESNEESKCTSFLELKSENGSVKQRSKCVPKKNRKRKRGRSKNRKRKRKRPMSKNRNRKRRRRKNSTCSKQVPVTVDLSNSESESDEENAFLVKEKHHRKYGLCSDSDEDVFSFMKRKPTQPSVKDTQRYVGSVSSEESIPGTCNQVVKRNHFRKPVVDSDEEADAIHVPTTLLPSGHDIVKSRGQRESSDANDHITSTQGDEIIIITSDDDDHPTIPPSKLNCGVGIKSKDENTKFQWTVNPDENYYSDSLPDLETDVPVINKQQQDEISTHIPGSSKAKLEELVIRDKIRKIRVEAQRRRQMTDKAQFEVRKRFFRTTGNSYRNKWISNRGYQPKEVKNGNRKPKQIYGIRKKILDQEGPRIRMLGGGSATIRRPPTENTRMFKPTTKPQTTCPKLKSKFGKPTANRSVPKRAPKLTTEQRFPSRQKSLLEDMKLETAGPSKTCRKNRLAESKSFLKLKVVQSFNLQQNKKDETSGMKTYESACTRNQMSLFECDSNSLIENSQVHGVTNLKSSAHDASVETSKLRVTFAENPQIFEIPSS